MRHFRKLQIVLLGILLLTSMGAPAKAFANSATHTVLPVTNFAGVVSECTAGHFFGLIPWYAYIGHDLERSEDVDESGNPTGKQKCEIKCFNLLQQSEKNACHTAKSDLPLVMLAVIDDMLRISGMVAVGYVLYGAFRYVASQGSPDETAKAQNVIMNALIGLALSTVCVGFVAFLGAKLGSI